MANTTCQFDSPQGTELSTAFMAFLTIFYAVFFTISSASAETEFHFRLSDERPTLDWGNGEVQQYVVLQLMHGLTLAGKNGEPQPALAANWKAKENKITFTLKKNAQWSDGVKVCARQFRDAWLRVLSKEFSSPYSHLLFDIKNAKEFHEGKVAAKDVGIEAKNCDTLVVETTRPLPYFATLASHWVMLPIRNDLIEKFGNLWMKPENLKVTGPYKLKSHEPEQSYVMEKNENFYGKQAKIDRITALIIRDDQTALRLFDQGKLDWLSDLPFFDKARLSTRDEYLLSPTLVGYYAGFNFGDGEKYPKELRCALKKSLNIREIELVLKGGEIAANGIVPELLGGRSKYAFEPQKTEGLAQNKKQTATFVSYSKDIHKPLVEWMQSQWKKNLKLDVELKVQEGKQYWASLIKGAPPFFLSGISAAFAHPYAFLSEFQSRAPANFGKFKNAKYDELLNKGDAKSLKEAERILLDQECAVIPLYFRQTANLVSTKWSAFQMNALARVDLSKVAMATEKVEMKKK